VQALEDIGRTRGEQRPEAGQERVPERRLGDAGPAPGRPHLLGRRGRRRGVALADDHVAPLASQQERGGEAADAGADDHDLGHAANLPGVTIATPATSPGGIT
jgi:hypothetical protein